jgi:hypothetical protein
VVARVSGRTYAPRVLRWCVGTVLALVLLGLTAAAVQAMPGDSPIEVLEPADGAALPVADIIPARFTCPVYRQFDYGGGFVQYGGAKDYTLWISRTPDVDANGKLAGQVGDDGLLEAEPDRCVAGLQPGLVASAQDLPGTYYWQVARLCVACTGGYEVGPVRRLVLRTTAQLSLRPPARVYGGFKFILPLRLAGVPDRTRVSVEYGSGDRWRPAGSAIALGERGDASVALPTGPTRLRAIVTLGAETVTSPPVALTVRRARRWTTSARDDGRYVMRPGGGRTKRLRVTRRGRELHGFEAEVPLLCPSALPGQPFSNQTGYAAVGPIRVAPDGSFVGIATAKNTAIRVRGRLQGRRIHAGEVELSVEHCTGSLNFTARRAGA